MTTQSPNSNQLDLEFLFMLDSLHDWYEDTKRIDHPELHIFLRTFDPRTNSPWKIFGEIYGHHMSRILYLQAGAVLNSKQHVRNNVVSYIEAILEKQNTNILALYTLNNPTAHQVRNNIAQLINLRPHSHPAIANSKLTRPAITKAKYWAYFSIIQIILKRIERYMLPRYSKIRISTFNNNSGVKTNTKNIEHFSIGWSIKDVYSYLKNTGSFACIDAIDVSLSPMSLNHIKVSENVLITPAQIFDSASTTFASLKIVKFMYMNNPLHRGNARNNQSLVFKRLLDLNPEFNNIVGDKYILGQDICKTFDYDFYYYMCIPSNISGEFATTIENKTPIINIETAKLKQIIFLCIPVCTRQNSIISTFNDIDGTINCIVTCPGIPSPSINNRNQNLYSITKTVSKNKTITHQTYFDKNNKIIVCRQLKGLSVNELAKLFQLYSSIIPVSKQSTRLKTDFVRFIFDIKRSGDTYQSVLCNVFNEKKLYLITQDYIACTIALHLNSRVIFTQDGIFYAFHKKPNRNSDKPSNMIQRAMTSSNIQNRNELAALLHTFNHGELIGLNNAMQTPTI